MSFVALVVSLVTGVVMLIAGAVWRRRLEGWVYMVTGGLALAFSAVCGVALIQAASPGRPGISFPEAVRAIAVEAGIAQPLPPPGDLEVLSARYGAPGHWLDVTRAARGTLRDRRLKMAATNEIAGDPVFGTRKRLEVEYTLEGNRQKAIVPEGALLRLPPDPLQPRQVITTPARLAALARACPAEVGFYGCNLVTGETVAYRPDQPACLASIVKVFALLEVMRRVEQGDLALSEPVTIRRQEGDQKTTLGEAVDLMIGISDNDATAAVAHRVGYAAINRLPKRLNLAGLSDQVLPEPGILERMLDRRVVDLRVPGPGDLLPQHGTARAVSRYFELLYQKRLLSPAVSAQVQTAFDRHDFRVAPQATPAGFTSGGKGGSILWMRLWREPYNMVGWGVLIRGKGGAVAFCLWCEWFPAGMSEPERMEWCHGLSDGIVNLLLAEKDGGKGKAASTPTP